MQHFNLQSISGFFSFVLVGLLAASLPVAAMVCISGPPTCFAVPGDRVCSNNANKNCHVNADCSPGTCDPAVLGIAGTVAANPNTINSVVLTGATNVTLTVGTTPGALVYFRAVQTNPALDAQATVLATDASLNTCKVPINFHIRTSGAASNEPVCLLAETYSLDVISSPSSPAGTTACSSHLAACTDTPPPGLDFLPGDSRILSVRSPIAGSGVLMEMTRTGAFDKELRLAFSRSTDFGASYTPFTDITSTALPGSTKIRGTATWSDIRVVSAEAPSASVSAVPTVGQWGLTLLILLMLSASSVLLMQRRFALASPGTLESPGPSLFVPRVYFRVLAGTAAVTLVGLAGASVLGLAPSATDGIGSLLCAGILAYLVHLWALAAGGTPREP